MLRRLQKITCMIMIVALLATLLCPAFAKTISAKVKNSSAKFYKILLGSFSIQIIVNGLALMGKADAHYSQSVQGILLLVILFLSALAARKKKKTKEVSPNLTESKKEAVK